jgi:hypothetical protein
LLFEAHSAQAACQESGASLGCVDAVPNQGPAEPSAFRWFAEGKVLPASRLALSLHYQFASKPIELVAPSADPIGRHISIVSRSHRTELRAATGLGAGVDVAVALPMSLNQAGAGSEALSTQAPKTIEQFGFGDLRLGLRTRLPKFADVFAWTLRFEVTLPTGDERSYLGEGSATETVATNVALSLGQVLIVGDLGAKVVKPRRVADVRLGSQLLTGLGVAYRVLSEDQLTVSTEGLLRPVLVDSPQLTSTDDTQTTFHTKRVLPAEWRVSVSSRPSSAPVWFSLGAGTALAFSSRNNGGAEHGRVDQQFIAPTSPRFSITTSVSVVY